MVVSLRAITDTTDLRITVVWGEGRLDVPLSGAHASEQPDPTPWLAGGELLMTDGLGLPREPAAQAAYVQRLARKGVAGLVLGLGAGLPFDECPPGLKRGAQHFRVPLLTVPVSTPFIAITAAFYSRLADERSALSERILKAHAVLTAAAADTLPLQEITRVTASLIGGWARLYDTARRPLCGDAELDPAIEEAVARQLAQLPSQGGLHVSSAESTPQGSSAIRLLGIDRLRGMLAYGRDETQLSEQYTQAVVSYADSLLSIELQRRHALHTAERRPGADVLRRLMNGVPPSRISQLLTSVGFLAERARLLIVDTGAGVAEDLVDSIQDAVGAALVLASGNRLFALLPADIDHIAVLRPSLAAHFAGLGGPARPQHFAATARQAEQALTEAHRRGGGLVDAMHLGDVQILLQLVSAEDLSTFADAVLRPIEQDGNGDSLLKSLVAFLASGTAVAQGSHRAQVHRHTMRRHLQRIEDITGRDLQDPRHRTEFWLAFQARDVAATL
jgi:PucR family transcriptional regulator, purine catabolism regulatory protein